MTKTFVEVINDIKKGEVWQSCDKTISYSDSGIVIRMISGIPIDCIVSRDTETYKLKREEHTIEEAWHAYEGGKEIESIYYRYKKIDNRNFYWLKRINKFVQWEGALDWREVINKWYIND